MTSVDHDVVVMSTCMVRTNQHTKSLLALLSKAQVSLYNDTASIVHLSVNISHLQRLQGSTPLLPHACYDFLIKCCYFLIGSEIQYGHPCFRLVDIQEVDNL